MAETTKQCFVDWDKHMVHTNWKRKKCQIVNPKNNELLAEVQLEPTDHTRRAFKTKMLKWYGQYPQDTIVADYFLDRINSGGLAGLMVRADAKYIRCGCKSTKKR